MTQDQFHRKIIIDNKRKLIAYAIGVITICLSIFKEGADIVSKFSAHTVKIESLEKTEANQDVDISIVKDKVQQNTTNITDLDKRVGRIEQGIDMYHYNKVTKR